MEGKKLYIPVNIRKRKEVVDGIGKKEVLQILIQTGVGFFVGLLIYGWKRQMLYLLLPPMIAGMAGVIFFRKDQGNQSLVDRVQSWITFIRSQKRYRYVYRNIYEEEREVESKQGSKGHAKSFDRQ